ncbi:MAG: hypothetical protein KC800_26035, partial [Candidatus Eremiobacteraeota bacterium]|nr:hypothetical protein [Candidatus Eremiobacteraeota bacterium]
SDLPVLERGLRDPNPDIVLTCACIYGEHGPDIELLKQSLFEVVYSDRTMLGQAALGQLSRMELTGADGERLIEFIAPYVYDGIPAELFGALAAVDGPTDEILEEVYKRWKTLQQNFFSPSYQLAAQRSFVMEKVWELCRHCRPGPVRDFLQREAIVWNYKLIEKVES